MFSENSTPQTQARAFSFFAFAGNLGIFVGPVIGGSLAKPAEQLPWLFGSTKLFMVFPYLLPCIVAGLLCGSAALVNALYLTETRPAQFKRESAESVKPPSFREILSGPGVLIVLFIFEHGMMLGLSYTAVVPVYLYTPVNLGGLGLNPAQIALWMAASGMSQALWLLIVFPILQHRYGTGNVLRLCGVARLVVYATIPLLNVFKASGNIVGFWIMTPFIIVTATGVTMIYTGVQLALNDISPSRLALGTLNGIALSISSAVRAVAPAAAASIFAIGVKYHILYGYLIWVVLILGGIGFLVSLHYMPEKAEGRLRHRKTSDGHAG